MLTNAVDSSIIRIQDLRKLCGSYCILCDSLRQIIVTQSSAENKTQRTLPRWIKILRGKEQYMNYTFCVSPNIIVLSVRIRRGQ